MFTYESVEKFVHQRIRWATDCPGNAHIFENQAFGVVQFVSEQCWKSQPELEAKLIQMWNDEWRNLFWQIYKED